MRRFLPYLLPILSVLVLIVIFLIDPAITGFATRESILNVDVVLRTEEGEFLPRDAIVLVSLGDEVREIMVEEFINKSGGKFELLDEGYSGDYEYKLDISEFGLDNTLERGEYVLKIDVVYGDIVLSSDERTIEV